MLLTACPTCFSTDNFEGSLDELLILVQKGEVLIDQVSLLLLIHKLTEKKESSFSQKTEFIAPFATLLHLKSTHLLPVPIAKEEIEEEPYENGLEETMKEYSLFKWAALELLQIERQQSVLYPRGTFSPPNAETKPESVNAFSLEDLAKHFKSLLKKSSFPPKPYEDTDPFDIQEMVARLSENLLVRGSMLFEELFIDLSSKEEMIALFLALLELLKGGRFTLSQIHEKIVISYADLKTSH